MVPTFKEYVFDFAELKLLSAVCKKCSSEIILDVTDKNLRIPNSCPSCHQEFDSVFTNALKSFFSAYSNLMGIENPQASARIRIRQKVNVSEL